VTIGTSASPGGNAPASPDCEVRVGCSGWTYKSWRGRYYPDTVPARLWLEHYAADFDCVETNGTFYRLPEARTFADWAARTPAGFRLAVKASRFLTHMKRLAAPEEPVERLLTRASALGDKLGPILYQLPPDLQRNDERLSQFVAALPRTLTTGQALQHVIEFRHPSWYVPVIYDLLAAHGVSLCQHDKQGSEIDAPAVGPVLYRRFHGPTGQYFGRYSQNALLKWADRVAVDARDRDVWVFFNNDPEAAAVADAAVLRTALRDRLGRRKTRTAPDSRTPATSDPSACAPRSRRRSCNKGGGGNGDSHGKPHCASGSGRR